MAAYEHLYIQSIEKSAEKKISVGGNSAELQNVVSGSEECMIHIRIHMYIYIYTYARMLYMYIHLHSIIHLLIHADVKRVSQPNLEFVQASKSESKT